MSEPLERSGIARWTVSFGAVVAAHVVLAWSVLHLQPLEGLPAGEPVMLQLEPPAAQQQQPEEIPNPAGPEQDKTSELDKPVEDEEPQKEPEPQQTAQVPPEPEKEPEQEPEKEPEETVARVEPEPEVIPPAPPEVTPEVAVPLPEPRKPPEPEKPVEKKVEKKKPKPKPKQRREVAETSRPNATPQPSAQAAARSGAASNNASLASWRAALSAHLQRNKRNLATPGQNGTAILSFTIDRNGRVLSSSVGSSGHAALDQEARELIRRAQPLPAAPADVVGNRFPFAVPIRFISR